jgi:hypothetical protein
MFYLNARKLPGFSMHEMQCTHLLPLFYDLKSWDITRVEEEGRGVRRRGEWQRPVARTEATALRIWSSNFFSI